MRERKNALRRLNRLVGKGYQLNLDVDLGIPSDFISYTEYRKFKSKVKPENVLKKAKYETETGQVISGTEARKRERSASAKKGVQTRTERKYYVEEYTGEYLPRDIDVRQGFYDEDEYGTEAGTGEEPSQVDTAIRTIDTILSQLEEFDTANLTPSTAWDSKHVNPALAIKKYNLVMGLKDEIQNILDSATPQELKIIANNIENNSDEIKEIVDRLMYKLYKSQESTIEYEAAPDLKRLADIIRKG